MASFQEPVAYPVSQEWLSPLTREEGMTIGKKIRLTSYASCAG